MLSFIDMIILIELYTYSHIILLTTWNTGFSYQGRLSIRWANLGYFPSEFSSVTVMSKSLQLHGLQLPSPSPTPRVYSNSCPLSQWCHPTTSSSVVPFSSCPQSFPASGSFLVSQLFASGDQSIGVSTSVSVLPMNIQDWFPLRLTSLISLLSRGLSRVFFSLTVQKHQFFGALSSLQSSSHIHTWLLEEP